jgi:hypothetical protein
MNDTLDFHDPYSAHKEPQYISRKYIKQKKAIGNFSLTKSS